MDLVTRDLRLRPLRRRDRPAWEVLRRRNAAWLAPWEATSPESRPYRPTFSQYVRDQARAARDDSGYAFVMEYRGELVGQVTIAGVTRGSMQSASIGYWISEHVAGRGITTLAVAMAADHCWFTLGLHRVEINIRPENSASLRVVAKLGFREEGLRRGYLHIQGVWADHRSFALNAEEVGEGLVARWRATRPG
ncbi:GNAT family N-acetyltransferase [Ruania alba]|uniref:Ribosomal-protein-alanine N-acetyltransferase n=1 Tax=Ruania alba TaxID=648782 RepID=A0A1H5MXR7_9MICO|nr:GNAT family protein [Ruania alba]SEE94159.1 ribosomal-protein-alanine N-acetyltransferase [Ruania alba]